MTFTQGNTPQNERRPLSRPRVPKSWVYAESRRWEKTNGAAGIPTVTLGRYRRFRSDAIGGLAARAGTSQLKGLPQDESA